MPSLTLREVPADLHSWLEEQAHAHGRPIETEAIDLLERQRREAGVPRRRIGVTEILRIAERVAHAPASDERSADEILGYDSDGLPR